MDELEKKFINDRLSDNTQIEYCKQCETCVHWGKNPPWDNKHTKCYCEEYPYPNYMKPLYVINNEQPCTAYERRE